MKELGTYKIQYNQVVEVYSDMLYQYNILSKKFEEEGFEATIDTEKSGGKKIANFGKPREPAKGYWNLFGPSDVKC